MPMMPVQLTVTSTGTTRSINLDYTSDGPFNAIIAVSYGSSTTDAVYGLQYTYDDPLLTSLVGSTASQIWQDDPVLTPNSTLSKGVKYDAPVCAVRLNVTSISTGYLRFTVIQT